MTEFFSISNIMLTIPLGKGGYQLSWIEAIGTLFGLTCIYLASLEKTINYLFGLVNVTLFAIIFFQIQLYATLLLQIFFFAANLYGWYAWSRVQTDKQEKLQIRWLSLRQALLWLLFCVVGISYMTINIDMVFNQLTRIAIMVMQNLGMAVAHPQLEPDAYPFWDSCMMIFSIVAMLLMTRKYVENWILWVVINIISVMIFARQGVYFIALEYLLLTFIAINGTVRWIKSAKERGSHPLMS